MAVTLGVANPFRYRGYYYDTESGLYYLQTRYYDPAVGRFINADGLTSTDQDILGNNMYAYCLNNPVRYIDDEGSLPSLIEDKLIHDEVLSHICNKSGRSSLSWKHTCIYYNRVDKTNGWGFCDLVDTDSGEVWELKKDSNSRSCRRGAAQRQLDRYISGRLKYFPSLELQYPTTTIPTGYFVTVIGGKLYAVKYWDEGGGILRYKKTRLQVNIKEPKTYFSVSPYTLKGIIPDIYDNSMGARTAAAGACMLAFALITGGGRLYNADELKYLRGY